MADRIRGSCRGCLCFRNRGINDLATSICFAIVIAVDTRVLSIIKSYECVAVAMNASKYEWSNGNLSSNRQSNLGPHFCNLVGLLFYYGQNQDMMFKTSKGMTEKFVCSYGKEFMYENN